MRLVVTKSNNWIENIKRRIAEGWANFGQTNDLLLTIANLDVVKLNLKYQELVQYLLDTATSALNYAKYCRHQHEIEAPVGEGRNCEKLIRQQ